MDRLETYDKYLQLSEERNLHSSMDRLETQSLSLLNRRHKKFTFQYG